MNTSKDQKKPDWVGTSYANLIRYKPSGTYYARIRIKGKLIRRSLNTDVLSVAALRLSDFDKEERAKADVCGNVARGKILFGDASKILTDRIDADQSLKPRTKSYYQERIIKLYKSWPGIERRELRDITKDQCLAWSARFSKDMSPVARNHTVAIVRRIFKIGVEMGAIYTNPAESINWVKEKPKKLCLPELDQFESLVHLVETSGSGFASRCADLARFLAYGGFRIMEARNITWSDLDFKRGVVIVRGDPITGTKNTEVRKVPMIPEMRALLERLRADRPDEPPNAHVMEVKECLKALATACAKLGIPKLTHHDLRHLFATRCIESGVDIPTVSRWLGHKDGGALAMRVYGHLRDQHSTAMAARVSFATQAVANVLPMATKEATA